MDTEEVEVLPDDPPAPEGHEERNTRHRRRQDDRKIGQGVDEIPAPIVVPGVCQGERRPEYDDDHRAYRRGDEGEGESIKHHRFCKRPDEGFRRYAQEERCYRYRDEEKEEREKNRDEEGEYHPSCSRPAVMPERFTSQLESGQIHNQSVWRCRPDRGRML